MDGASICVAVILLMIFILVQYVLPRYWNIISFFLMKKPLDSSHHGGELVAKVLKAHLVENIFTLIGGHISPIIVAADSFGIRVVDTRNEVTAVFAADAMARLTGNVGVAVVTAGPGVTNTITAVKNAQMAQSPILLIGGAAPTLLKGRGALQDMDQLALFKSICKDYKSVHTVREIIPVIRKAIQTALSDTPGPVFVEIPVDVLYPLETVMKEVGSSKSGKSLQSRIINWYLDWHVYNIFFDGFEPQEMRRLCVQVPHASDNEVEKSVKLFSESKKPVIIFGSQALIPATCATALRNAVNSLQVPCFLGGMSRGLLGRNSPLQLRHTRKEVLKEADLVILAGATCDFRLSYGKVLARSCKIIAVNRNRKDLLMNSDVFWKPTLLIQGCISDYIIRLEKAQSCKTLDIDKEWCKNIFHRDAAKEILNRKEALSVPDHNLNPLQVLYALEESVRDDTIIIVDGGDFVATASYILRPRGPLKWLDPGPFGTLGVGAGFALGAKLCCPHSDVLILYGDGSLGYSLIEFDTFVRHKLPVIAVVGNDACWTQISREQVPLFNSNVGCSLSYSNYHLAVEGLGAKGMLLTSEDREILKEKFQAAVMKSFSGESVLVNALISTTSFRKGSISV